MRLRLDLFLRLVELRRRDARVREPEPHHLRLLRLRAARLIGGDLRLRQRLGAERAAQDVVRARHDHGDLLDLLRELLRSRSSASRTRRDARLHVAASGTGSCAPRPAPASCSARSRRVSSSASYCTSPSCAADEVPAVHVVGVAVVVVVLAVAGDLFRVRPEVRPEPDVRGVDAAIDHGDDDRALRLLPGEQLALRLPRADADDPVRRRVQHLPVARGFGDSRGGRRRRRRRSRLGRRGGDRRGRWSRRLGDGSRGSARSERGGAGNEDGAKCLH